VFYPAGQGEISAQVALKVRNMGGTLTTGQILRIRNSDYEWDDSLEILKRIGGQQIPDSLNTNKLVIDKTRQEVRIIDVQKLNNDHYRIVLDQILSDFNIGDGCRIRGRYFQIMGDGSQVETTDEASRTVVEQQILYPGCLMVEQVVRLYKQAIRSRQMEGTQTPARLHRVWETALQFWRDLRDKLGVGEISPRLCIRVALPETELRNKLARFHTYELKLHNINLSVSKVANEKFITVDNLQRIAILLNPSKVKEYREDYGKAASYVDEQLQELRRTNRPIEVEEPTGYGSANRSLGMLHITKVEPDKASYVPAIPFLTEPRTFMALVPADKAIQVVEDIKKKYEEEMGKVRNRLPVTVGVVFAGRRTPLPAILDAGRRMLKQPTEAARWQVKKVNLGSYPEKASLTLGQEQDESPTFTLDIPVIMGDGITEDVWYPYWRLEKERNNPSSRARVFKGIDGKNWVHISDLQEGDTVSFMPSRLDFEFLDTASRRFEVSYDGGERRGSVHPARPYYLEQLDELKGLWEMLSDKTRGLATSQIHNLVGLIEAKRSEWYAKQDDPVFKQIVKDIIANVWKDCPDLHRFVQAAVSGQLTDVVELHMTILKEGGNE